MKILVINGTEKHGITYRLKELFLERLREKASITEYYLPKDCPAFCNGCASCMLKGEHTIFCRRMQNALHKNDPEYLDGRYWEEYGWLGKTRPWRA